MTSERLIMVPDWLVEEAASLIEQAGLSGTGVSLTAPRLRAALAQPAAGEPEQQTAINADDLPTKKYPLGAFDFDAPVAAGEPVAWMTRPRIGSYEGREFICEPDAALNLDQWEKPFPVYAAPPAAAHVDERCGRMRSGICGCETVFLALTTGSQGSCIAKAVRAWTKP